MGQAHSHSQLVHVKHKLVKSSVETKVLLYDLPLEKYRERVIDIKVGFCGCRRPWPDPINGSVKFPQTAINLIAIFNGRALRDDEWLKHLDTSRENPIHIRTFQHPPAPIRRHDTHISALPVEILHGHLLPILSNSARVAFACTSSHFDAVYKSSPTCDMAKVNCYVLNGDDILIKAISLDQSHRVISRVVTERSDITARAKHTALLLALCRDKGQDIVRVLLDPDAGNAMVDTWWNIRADKEIRRHLHYKGLQRVSGTKLRDHVRALAKRSDVLSMLEPFLNPWSSDPLRPDEQDECAICMESHASYQATQLSTLLRKRMHRLLANDVIDRLSAMPKTLLIDVLDAPPRGCVPTFPLPALRG